MALTAAQLVTFKADIDSNTDPVIVQALVDGTNNVIKDWYNDPASPDFYGWRTDLTTSEVKDAVDWTEYIGRSDGERGAFMLLIEDGIVNAGKANVRAGFQDIFSGPNGATTRAALTAVAKRTLNRIEKLFGTGGDGSNGSPVTMGYEGSISLNDVRAALALA